VPRRYVDGATLALSWMDEDGCEIDGKSCRR
jgi:hypothetical protein